MNKIKLPPYLTGNIILLGLVSLCTDLSSQMVFPLLPLYLTQTLGAGPAFVGLVEGSAESAASFLKLISGYLSDKSGKRKPFVFWGYGLSALIKPLFAFAFSWMGVLFLRIAERMGKGLRNAPRDAIVADAVDKRYRGKAYGFHRSMDGAGSVLGALMAYLLLPIWGFRGIFLFSAVFGILALGFILPVREKKQISPIPDKNGEKKEPGLKGLIPSLRVLPSNLKLFILSTFIFSLGHFGYPFLLLSASQKGWSNDKTLFLYVVFYLVYTFVSIPAGSFSDRRGRKPALFFGYLIFTGVCGLSVFITGWHGIMAVFILYGVFFAFADGVQRAFTADLAPPELKATALGAYSMAVGLASLPGGFIAGLLWEKAGFQATFIYGGVLTLVSLVFLSAVKKEPVKIQPN